MSPFPKKVVLYAKIPKQFSDFGTMIMKYFNNQIIALKFNIYLNF